MKATEIAETSLERPAGRILSPATFRGLTLKNRLVVSPMCTYSAGEGLLDDFHLVHLGRFAMGGAGLVFVEATAVSKNARITHGCAGLWNDAQIGPMKRVADFLHRFGSAAGIQLSHAGPKASSQRPWEGGGPLGETDLEARGEGPWLVESVTTTPFDTGWAKPSKMTTAEIAATGAAFVDAAKRADAADFDVIEIHCAHGYLLHSFLSPISNARDDEYGGDLAGRMRFPLEVIAAVRQNWPERKPLFVRISSVDGIGVGWSIDDSVAFAKALKAIGVDAIDCSSGGMKLERAQNFLWRGPGFHVPFAERIRTEAGLPTIAVGLIRDADQAEAILAEEKADLVSIAREALFDPNWPARSALAVAGERGWSLWPEQFAWWLSRRERQEKDGYGPRRDRNS
jgi:2,4-dienoyl-CoA reductase-like NADH-dependent reductase (Old Yellow Enzyme family)